MSFELIEWIGYTASFIILVSLLMRSLKRLRIINTVGAVIFAVYGALIDSPPVMIMNTGIALINLYYLKQFFASKEYFTVLPIERAGDYSEALIDFHRKDIERFMPLPDDILRRSTFRFLVLRNMVPAGIFLARAYDRTTVEVTVDYAIRPFQDFKTGAHIYEKERHRFKEAGYDSFIAFPASDPHKNYLEKMGFEPTIREDRDAYIKAV